LWASPPHNLLIEEIRWASLWTDLVRLALRPHMFLRILWNRCGCTWYVTWYAPMQSAPMPGRITVKKQTLRRAGECTKMRISRSKNVFPYTPLAYSRHLDLPLHILCSMLGESCSGSSMCSAPSGGTRILEQVGQQQGLKQYGRASNYLG